MSALSPHIRVLRALGGAVTQAAEVRRDAFNKSPSSASAPIFLTAAVTLDSIGAALDDAAERLEAEEEALAETLLRKPGDITYDPKGKNRSEPTRN